VWRASFFLPRASWPQLAGGARNGVISFFRVNIFLWSVRVRCLPRLAHLLLPRAPAQPRAAEATAAASAATLLALRFDTATKQHHARLRCRHSHAQRDTQHGAMRCGVAYFN
jgi:hypothetical protein